MLKEFTFFRCMQVLFYCYVLGDEFKHTPEGSGGTLAFCRLPGEERPLAPFWKDKTGKTGVCAQIHYYMLYLSLCGLFDDVAIASSGSMM
jgi:hypothetical protein